MVNIRNYDAGVVTGLVSVSQGTCYWPGCDERIVRFVDGVPVNNFETAHIRAANEGGPRYDPAMRDDEERNSFSNLVLLCVVHHKVVDKLRPDDFSIEMLQRWKAERETAGQAALQGLRGLTEDRLQELIAGAFESFRATFDDALARLEQIDLEAANLLRPLVNELAEARFQTRFPDADTAEMLLRAGNKLSPMVDTAPVLANAARNLAGLKETADQLSAVVKRARGLM